MYWIIGLFCFVKMIKGEENGSDWFLFFFFYIREFIVYDVDVSEIVMEN